MAIDRYGWRSRDGLHINKRSLVSYFYNEVPIKKKINVREWAV